MPRGLGSYETVVQPELEAIVRERVETLWDQGNSGADLVIASVGAGLRAFTGCERVEYANGEKVPAELFVAEIEKVILDSIFWSMARIKSWQCRPTQAGRLCHAQYSPSSAGHRTISHSVRCITSISGTGVSPEPLEQMHLVAQALAGLALRG